MLSAEMAALPAEVALEVRGDFDDLALWLKHVLESGVRGKQFKLGASVQIEARKFVSLFYGAMLAARAYGDATLFRDVTADAVKKLVKPRKQPAWNEEEWACRVDGRRGISLKAPSFGSQRGY
jgi:TetR/AcrR family transcriptional repressor of nem operon